MKQKFNAICPVLLGVLLLAAPVRATIQYEYTTNAGNTNITITKYVGVGGAVVIPTNIATYTVVSIGSFTFYQNTNITTVTIPNTITNIGEGAFELCFKMTNVTIPASIASIGAYAFYGCSNLASVTIPNGTTNLGAAAFTYCTNLASASIASSVNAIGAFDFFGCFNLASVRIYDGVANIQSNAFVYCTALADLRIPPSVTNIGTQAFVGCSALTNIIVFGNAVNFQADAFEDCVKLTTVLCETNAPPDPAGGASVFAADSQATVYYLPGMTGWGSSFGGRPAVELKVPTVTTQPANERASTNGAATFSVTAAGALLRYEWRFNNSLLGDSPGITGWNSNKLTISPAVTANEGSYSVFVGNYAGSVLSSNGTLTLVAETTKPSVAITSPTAHSRTNAPVLKGTAYDSVRVEAVAYWVTNINNGVTTTFHSVAALAAGTGTSSNWTIPATILLPGTNILAVQSSNYSGLNSPVENVTFFYRVTAPLGLYISPAGAGTITGVASIAGDHAPPSDTNLYIGEQYTLTARPTNNWFLNNWTASSAASSTNLAFSFIMEPNLAVSANFNTNLFIYMAGRYDGLFSPFGPGATNSGLIGNLRVGTNGVYSGKMYLAGTTSSLSGAFNRSGQTTEPVGNIPIAGGKVSLTLDLQFLSDPREITGAVQGSNWNASELFLYAATTNRNNATNYTMLLEQQGIIFPFGPTYPPNFGYAFITNTGSMINMGGVLSDGTAFSESVPINGFDEFPVYATFYSNPGLLFGSLSLSPGLLFPIISSPPSGNIVWLKPAQKTGLYTNAFVTGLNVEGSTWTPSTNVLTNLFPNGAMLTISGGNLSNTLSWTVACTPSNTFVRTNGLGSATNLVSGSINRANGQMTVTFTNTSGKKVVASGALVPNSRQAGGFFLGTTNTGTISLVTPFPIFP